MKIDFSKKIIKKINSKKATISVIGLGYVGLPLCLALSKAKFKVFGIDNNVERVKLLKNGISYISTIKNSQIRKLDNKKFIPTNDFKEILNSDAIIICVPTPIDSRKKPNMKYVKNVVKQIDKYVKKFQTIIFECTSYPGTTEEYFLPILKKKKFNVGKNFFLGYSPEREDPGNENYSILKNNLSKVVSGYSESCRNIVKAIYEQVSNEVYLCNDIKTAEFTKLLENIYRSVNIGLINELHTVCKKMNINIFDAINAAKTKPFGFNSFYPGPGVGGHCIPVDPYFLTYKAKQLGINTKFIKLAGKINDNRPNEISREILNYIKKNKLKKNILIMGITYKKNSDDLRESPILKVYNLLNKKMKNKVLVCDPMLSNFNRKTLKNINFIDLKELDNKSFHKKIDLCFIGSNHDAFNYKKISKNFKTIFDSRDSFGRQENNIKII
jgi:UDP-N-acetyl-D-glucosamine dehydrogenase